MSLGAMLTPSGNAAGTMGGSYVDGDVMGTLTTLTSCVSSSGGSGVIEKAMVWDDSDSLLAFDLYVASASVTQASDSAAFAPSDSDNRLYVARLQFPAPADVGGARIGKIAPFDNIYCAATSLFVTMVARSTMASSITASAIKMQLWIRQDQ
jgi:hypothetical protein